MSAAKAPVGHICRDRSGGSQCHCVCEYVAIGQHNLSLPCARIQGRGGIPVLQRCEGMTCRFHRRAQRPSPRSRCPACRSISVGHWGCNADGVRIERCPSAGLHRLRRNRNGGCGTTNFSDTGVTAGNTFRYRVRAFGGGGDSPFSNFADATTPPGVPTAPAAATGASTQINLTWIALAGRERVNLERCAGAACTTFAEIGQIGGGIPVFTNTGRRWKRSTLPGARVQCWRWVGYSNIAGRRPPSDSDQGCLVHHLVPSEIAVRWTDTSATDGLQDRSVSGTGCVNFTEVAQVGAGVTLFERQWADGLDDLSVPSARFNAGGASLVIKYCGSDHPRSARPI